jgi:uncharacterized protein (TIGR00251 family)
VDTAATWWRNGPDGLTVLVHVVPNARRTDVAATSGGRLRVRLAAPAVDDKANDEAVRFLASLFGVRPRDVRLLIGARARDKTFRIAGVTEPPAALLQTFS